MKYIPTLLILLLAFMLFIGMANNPPAVQKQEKHPAVDFTVGCTECHTEATPEAVASWAASDHGVMNFGCYMCHGDGDENFEAKPSDARCFACHDDKQFDHSKTAAKSCYDCHRGHSLKFHHE